ncbi:MAG: phospholipase D-like domain-containing protein, partial [Promethearchaeota archaeon]
MRKIIDNEPKKYDSRKFPNLDFVIDDRYTMVDAIKEIIDLQDAKSVDIATGYFNLSGWKLLELSLLKLKSLRLLLGWEVKETRNIEDTIQQWLTKELEDIPIEDYAKNRIHVQSLINFLRRENPKWVEMSDEEKIKNPEKRFVNLVHIFSKPHLHGKLYLFPKTAIVGSSNFTYGGLKGNTELNVVVNDPEQINLLRAWFNHFFYHRDTIDYRASLIEILEGSRFGDKEYDPWWVYLKIIFEYHKYEILKELEGDNVVKLAAFQEEGVSRALRIIEEFGGVMIADAVGLGKSFMGAHIMR